MALATNIPLIFQSPWTRLDEFYSNLTYSKKFDTSSPSMEFQLFTLTKMKKIEKERRVRRQIR